MERAANGQPAVRDRSSGEPFLGGFNADDLAGKHGLAGRIVIRDNNAVRFGLITEEQTQIVDRVRNRGHRADLLSRAHQLAALARHAKQVDCRKASGGMQRHKFTETVPCREVRFDADRIQHRELSQAGHRQRGLSVFGLREEFLLPLPLRIAENGARENSVARRKALSRKRLLGEIPDFARAIERHRKPVAHARVLAPLP
jgi:hypothetical protein